MGGEGKEEGKGDGDERKKNKNKIARTVDRYEAKKGKYKILKEKLKKNIQWERGRMRERVK